MSSLLKQANQSLRSGKYDDAIDLYARALQELPALRSVIQFNLELAQRRQRSNAAEGLSLSSQQDMSFRWVSHATLQNGVDCPCIALGGMVLGYPEKGSSAIPRRIIECVLLYVKIAQIRDEHSLFLHTGVELIRPHCESFNFISSVFVHVFDNNDIRLTSIWHANSRDLRIGVEKSSLLNQSRILRAYQYDPVVGGGLVLVGECVLQGDEWQLTDLALANPYLPVLLILAKPDGYLTDATLIPYPSLLHGGIHEHECFVGNDADINDPVELAQTFLQEHLRALEYGWALGLLQVDIREAIGTETILSTDFKEWLGSVFSLRIKSWRPPEFPQALAEYWQTIFATSSSVQTVEQFNNQVTREREGRTLLCPPRAIPSLRALTLSRASGVLEQLCGFSEFLLVQEESPSQRYWLSWPEMAVNAESSLALDGAIHVPMVLVGKNEVTKQESDAPVGVCAILVREFPTANNILQLIRPIAPDFDDITYRSIASYEVNVVVTVEDMSTKIFAAFLESISQQHHVNLRQIVVILPASGCQETFDTLLRRSFAGRYLLLPACKSDRYNQRVQRATNAIKHQTEDTYMLFINQSLVLHDPRTLIVLAQALSIPKVVTTSALSIGSIEIKSKPEVTVLSGGIFPVQGRGQKQIEWLEESLATALPKTTLPVASHGDAFFMIKAKEWKKSGGFADLQMQDERAAYEYSAKLSARNKLHLLVPHVTVELHRAGTSKQSSSVGWKPLTNQTVHAVGIRVLPS